MELTVQDIFNNFGNKLNLSMPMRYFSAEAAPKAAEAPRGPIGAIFSFLPRWGSPYVLNYDRNDSIVDFGENWVFTSV